MGGGAAKKGIVNISSAKSARSQEDDAYSDEDDFDKDDGEEGNAAEEKKN